MTMTDSVYTVACLMSMCSAAAIASSANAPSYTQASAGSATGHGRMTLFPEGEGLTPSVCYVSRLSLTLRASLLAWQLPVGTTTGLRLVWFAHSATLPDSQPVFRHRGYDHGSCEASRATSQAWPASLSLMLLCASR